jgi:hypothetical protein
MAMRQAIPVLLLMAVCAAQSMIPVQAYDASTMQIVPDAQYYVRGANGTYMLKDPSDITPADSIMIYSPSKNLCAWLNPMASQQLLYPCKEQVGQMYSIWDFPQIGIDYGIKIVSSGIIFFVLGMLLLLWLLFLRRR